MTDERNHPASPMRRDQARRDGDIPKSFELAGALHLLGALTVAFLMLGGIGKWLKDWTIAKWKEAGQIGVGPDDLASGLQADVFSLSSVLAPLLLLMLGMGVLAHWVQTGIVFRPQQAVPEASRLGPRRWFSHLFSLQFFAAPVLGLPKALLAVASAFVSAWCFREQFFALGGLPVESLVASLFGLVIGVCASTTMVILVLSIADYGIKRLSFERRIRMSDQEVRDELRMQNGDPTINSRRRQIHRSFVE